MMHRFFILISLFLSVETSAQHRGLTMMDAETEGLTLDSLDRNYLSAVHVDSSKAVFKTAGGQESVLKAYVKMMEDFGKFLSSNNYNWKKPTRCFNRVYFNTDGTIDYFLYNFNTKDVSPEDLLTKENQQEFNRLLNLFIRDYKIPVQAKTKFSQCSPTTYMPGEK